MPEDMIEELEQLDVSTKTITFPATYTLQKTQTIEKFKNYGNTIRKNFFGTGQDGFKSEVKFYHAVGELGITSQEAISLIKKGLKAKKKSSEE